MTVLVTFIFIIVATIKISYARFKILCPGEVEQVHPVTLKKSKTKELEMDNPITVNNVPVPAPVIPPVEVEETWRAVVDQSSGQSYWWNIKAGETTEVGAPKPPDMAAPEEAPSDLFKAMKADEAAEAPELPRRNLALRDIQLKHSTHKTELYDYGAYTGMSIPNSNGEIEIPVDYIENLSTESKKRLSLKTGVDLKAVANNAILTSTKKFISKKSNTFINRVQTVLYSYRLPFFDWSMGNVLIFIFYLLMNLFCLYISPSKDYGRNWGDLAAFNTALLIIPATRNSILTIGLGLPFDHVVVYHRFFGRFTIFCVIVHFGYYIKDYSKYPYAFLTGFGAMVFGLFIMVTSLDYVRRNLFNFFFWSHYSFIGYFGLAYVHCPQTKPYIIVAILLYVADKLLRMVWMLWPRTMTTFTNKGESIAHVSTRHY